MVEKTNQNCAIKDTEICDFLGCDGCEKCTLAGGLARGMDPQDSAARWRETLSLVPKEIDSLHTTETCVFCGERRKDCYGELSLGHRDPEYKKGIILGLGKKVRCEIGSLLDIPVACCNSCKRKMRMQDMLQYGIVLAFFILAVVLVSIPAIGKPLEEIHFMLPLGIVVVIAIVGFIVARIVDGYYVKKCEQTMNMNPLEIPVIKKMLNIGWFPVPEVKRGYPQLHFSKKKPRENFHFFSE